jgi:hypothetical protein
MGVTVAKLLVLPLLGLLAPMSGPQLPSAVWTGAGISGHECPMARAKRSGPIASPSVNGDGESRFYGSGQRAAHLLP